MAYESTLEQWAVGGRHSFKTKYKAPAASVGENSGFFIGFLQRKTIGKKDETLDNTVFFCITLFFGLVLICLDLTMTES